VNIDNELEIETEIMEQKSQLSFYLTFLPNGIAHGIIGTLIPIYMIQSLGASLIDIGVMTFAASALLIPSSIFLGSLPDRTRASKPFILLSLIASSILLYIMSSITSILLFQILYIGLELATYLKGPSTSTLIAESFERNRRGAIIANQGFIESLGAVIGLGLCTILVGVTGYQFLLIITTPLILSSFILGLFTIKDSPLYIERNLDRFDRMVGNIEDLSYHLSGDGSLTPDLDGEWKFSRVANMRLYGIGRAIFAFAASNAFTTLSIFLLTKANFASSLIFLVFLVRNVFGALSYLFVDRVFGGNGGVSVKLGTLMRVLLVLLLPVTLILPMPLSAIFVAIILSLVAVSWSIYSVGYGIVTILYAQSGSLGLYDAFASLGGAIGNYTGGLIPTIYGFEALFIFSGILFAAALVIFYFSRV
jgi:predicted MFS family arabinose efflux permease